MIKEGTPQVAVWLGSFLDYIKYKGEKYTLFCSIIHSFFFPRLLLSLVSGVILALRLSTRNSKVNVPFYILLIFAAIADGSFQALLMLIAYGWKITREKLADGAGAIFYIPITITVSMLTYTWIWAKGGMMKGNTVTTKPIEIYLLIISSLVYLLTMVYMWGWVFRVINIEKARLARQIQAKRSRVELEDVIDESEGLTQERNDAQAMDHPVIDATDTGVMTGVDITHQPEAITEEEEPTSNNEIDGVQRRLREGPENDTATMPLKAKLALLSRYFLALSLYLVSSLIVPLVTMYATPGSTSRLVLLACHNALSILFMAGL
eukprot:Ihof_evm3s383 gene=Ihof_evmTU3s383